MRESAGADLRSQSVHRIGVPSLLGVDRVFWLSGPLFAYKSSASWARLAPSAGVVLPWTVATMMHLVQR